jgi:hypothetical protein
MQMTSWHGLPRLDLLAWPVHLLLPNRGLHGCSRVSLSIKRVSVGEFGLALKKIGSRTDRRGRLYFQRLLTRHF